MATILDVTQAIITAWRAESSMAAVNGPYDEKPPGINVPYCIISEDGSLRAIRTTEDEIWQYRIQLVIWHSGRESLKTAMNLVGNFMDDIALDFTLLPGAVLSFDRIREGVVKEDKTMHRGWFVYQAIRKKPRLDV